MYTQLIAKISKPHSRKFVTISVNSRMNFFEKGQVLLINKPYGWTSFDVVRKLRGQMKIKKVGHAGTLDPLATGLLIVCAGAFTKKINEYMAQEKEYTGVFILGATTPTYDLESTPTDFKPIEHVTKEAIQVATIRFLGEIFQVPPSHSAIKKDGQRAYELARRGEEIKLEPRKVFIREFSIEKIEMPEVHFRVICSTGTYIRSLADDFGKALGCGAFLSKLCRTRIGDFLLTDALSVEDAGLLIRQKLDQNG
jgi:tRNA pseudouridine55 synthase